MRPFALALLLVAPAAVALGAAWSCLPDLVVSEASDAQAAPSGCGDGFVDPDAGEECDPGVPDGGLAATECLSCRVACVVGSDETAIDPSTNHCYFAPGPITVEDVGGGSAESACEGAGGHVVRFVSQNEYAFVNAWVSQAPYWVGIELDNQSPGYWFAQEGSTEPGWAAQCPGCFAGSEDGGGVVADPKAKIDAGGRCVVSDGDDSHPLFKSICTVVKPGYWTVCEREPVGTRTRRCGQNLCMSVAATQAFKRYVVLPKALGANDAIIGCAEVGGRLVVFGTAEEREQVAYELAAQAPAWQSVGFWIGLSMESDGGWAWDSDGGMTPLPWGVAQPADLGPTERAYVLVEQDQPTPDSELPRSGNASDAGGEMHVPVCELP